MGLIVSHLTDWTIDSSIQFVIESLTAARVVPSFNCSTCFNGTMTQ